jgi:tetratricopeptide (TPR) repeat protein
MAKKKQNNFEKQDERLQEVNETLTGAGKWIQDHSNQLSWCLSIVVLAIAAVIAFRQFVLAPKQVQANEENAKAAAYFMAANEAEMKGAVEQAKALYELALKGDDSEFEGFANTADGYHNQQGELAALYAGIIYFEQGQFEDAVEYLKKFSADDININAAAKQLLGDAYVEQQDYEAAAKAFEVAAKSGNEAIAPMSLKKAGIVYLHEGENGKALKAFKAIKENYAASPEANDIDKYIAIAE